jgi:hypothetical protein
MVRSVMHAVDSAPRFAFADLPVLQKVVSSVGLLEKHAKVR